jgi:hypothetical protein
MLKRRGYIEVPLSLATDEPQKLLAIQADIAITDVLVSYQTDSIRFSGRSHQFQEIENHIANLGYSWLIGNDSKITYTRRG